MSLSHLYCHFYCFLGHLWLLRDIFRIIVIKWYFWWEFLATKSKVLWNSILCDSKISKLSVLEKNEAWPDQDAVRDVTFTPISFSFKVGLNIESTFSSKIHYLINLLLLLLFVFQNRWMYTRGRNHTKINERQGKTHFVIFNFWS